MNDQESDDSTLADNEEPPSQSAFTSIRHVSANIASIDATAEYQLRNCYLLDSGADEHVCNDRSRFLTFTPAAKGDYLVAGDTTIPIQGYGTIEITARRKDGQPRIIQLLETAFVPSFHTNVISYRLHWNTAILRVEYTYTVW